MSGKEAYDAVIWALEVSTLATPLKSAVDRAYLQRLDIAT